MRQSATPPSPTLVLLSAVFAVGSLVVSCAQSDGEPLPDRAADGGQEAEDGPEQLCAQSGRMCGLMTGDDGYVDCGACSPGAACSDTGQCEAIAAGGFYGEVSLIRRRHLYEREAMRLAATARALLAQHTQPPPDQRESFQTADGETCTRESSPENYPYLVNGVQWPERPLVDGGKLTIEAEAAPGAIELATLDLGMYGTVYSHQGTPPAIKDGSATFANWFSADYLPEGAAFRIKTAGGEDLPAIDVTTGLMPPEPTGLSPALVADSEPADRPTIRLAEHEPIRITWTPVAGNHTMEIEYNAYSPGGETRLKCAVADDGELFIPYEAVKNYRDWHWTAMFFRRRVVRTLHPIPGDQDFAVRVEAASEVLGMVTTK